MWSWMAALPGFSSAHPYPFHGALARPGKISTWWHQFLQLREQEGSEAVTSKSVIVAWKRGSENFQDGLQRLEPRCCRS